MLHRVAGPLGPFGAADFYGFRTIERMFAREHGRVEDVAKQAGQLGGEVTPTIGIVAGVTE